MDLSKYFMDLYLSPIFKKEFTDFFVKMQSEGLDAARKSMPMFSGMDKSFDHSQVFEQMAEFFSNMGFVPQKKYDEALKENERLKRENEFLKDTIQKLNLKVFSEGSAALKDTWEKTIDKQLQLSKDFTEKFFDLLKEKKGK